MKTKKIFIILILATICLVFITLSAQAIDYPEIGGEGPGTSLEGYVRYIYLFALSIVGIAALGAITYGGITYMLSDTITSKDEAKKWIWGAVSGLILALAAYLILYTINPDLVNWRKPPITSPPTNPAPTCRYSREDPVRGLYYYKCSSTNIEFSGYSHETSRANCLTSCQ